MKKNSKQTSIVYANEYARTKVVVINNMAKKYSIPKLFIPKNEDGKPTVEKGKYWYVWYYYRNPVTNRMDRTRPIIIKEGINRFKTVRERKKYGQELVQVYHDLLKNGYSPYDESKVNEFSSKRMTVEDALNYALEHKKAEVKESTFYDYENRKNNFVDWLRSKNLHLTFVDDIKKSHITTYLNDLSKTMSNRNVNNHKTVLSALFTKLVDDNDEILSTNVILNIKNRITKPSMHEAFTNKELEVLKKHLIKHDPYLYDFMRFVAYSFMRNREVTRLKVKDIDLDNWTITIESKTDTLEQVPVIMNLREIIEKLNLEKYNPNDYIFTPEEKPGTWETKRESYKVNFFSKRFKKVKEALKLDFNKTIYAMRHTAAIDLYNYFLSQGLNEREIILKMLPITRHSNESGLRNYLRKVNAFKVEDYSDKFSMDF